MKKGLMIFFVVCLVLSLVPPSKDTTYGQGTQPDFVNLEFITVPNVLVVDIMYQNATSTGVEGIFTVKNPLTTLYLPYRITASSAQMKLRSPVDAVWERIGLLPSGATFEYDFVFDSTTQAIEIESNPLSATAIVFNLLELVSNNLIAVPTFSPAQIAQAVEKVVDFEQRATAAVGAASCFAGAPPPISELRSCTSDIFTVLDSPEFRYLLADYLAQIGVSVSQDTVDTFFAARQYIDRLGNLVDAQIYATLVVASGERVNRYILRPMTLDVNNMPPWNPVPVRPNGVDTPLQPIFEWNSRVKDTTSYTLQIDDEQSFVEPRVHEVTLSSNVYPLPISLEPNTFYYWRVQGHNPAGDSAWSKAIFQTQGPQGPVLVEPLGNNTPTLPHFEWLPLPDAMPYTLSVSTSGYFMNLDLDVSTSASNYDASAPLPADQTYYWRVTAHLQDETSVSSYGKFATIESAAPNEPITSDPTEAAVADAVSALFTQTAVAAQAPTQQSPTPAPQTPTHTATPQPGQDPVSVAREWANAIGELDVWSAGESTCEAYAADVRESLTTAKLLIGLLSLGTLGNEALIDWSGVEFTLIQSTPTTATVHVEGMYVPIVGESEYLNENMPLVYESGRWKVCQSSDDFGARLTEESEDESGTDLMSLYASINIPRRYVGKLTMFLNPIALELYEDLNVELIRSYSILDQIESTILVHEELEIGYQQISLHAEETNYAVNAGSMEFAANIPEEWELDADFENRSGLTLIKWPKGTARENYGIWPTQGQAQTSLIFSGEVIHDFTGLQVLYFTAKNDTLPMSTDSVERWGFPSELPKEHYVSLLMKAEISPALTQMMPVLLAQWQPNTVPLDYQYASEGEYWVEPTSGEIIDSRHHELITLCVAEEFAEVSPLLANMSESQREGMCFRIWDLTYHLSEQTIQLLAEKAKQMDGS